VVIENNGRLEIIAERQAYLLFDRMVAYHVVNGIPIPMDASEFYKGLKERFIERDGMYFLPDQVNQYDEKRFKMDLDNVQLSLVVTDERVPYSGCIESYQLLKRIKRYSQSL